MSNRKKPVKVKKNQTVKLKKTVKLIFSKKAKRNMVVYPGINQETEVV